MANEPSEPKSPIEAGALADLFFKGLTPPSRRRGVSLLRDLIEGPPSITSLALPPPPVIQDRWFKDETLKIDGYTFERCRFDRCKLMTEMATFTFKQCFIAGDCELYFIGPALKVARLLMHTLRIKARLTALAGEEAVFATLNPDGTFSLE